MINGAIAVTGASRGIGAAISLELAKRGFKVACLTRSGGLPSTERPLAEDLRSRLLAVKCDVIDEAAIKQAFEKVDDWAGGIRGLVNNAGFHKPARASSIRTADFEEVMRVNTTAVFVACREVYPYLIKQDRSLIINIGSFFEKLGAKGSISYCASKAAVGGITRCLAAEWGGRGVAVVNVAPGYIETDLNRDFLNDKQTGAEVRSRVFVGRPGRVEEVARLVAAFYVEDIPFLTGETIFLDGGQSVAL